MNEINMNRWPVTDGRKPTNPTDWQKHHDYIAEVDRKQRVAKREAVNQAASDRRQQRQESQVAKQRQAALDAYLTMGGKEDEFPNVWSAIQAQQAAKAITDLDKPKPTGAVRF